MKIAILSDIHLGDPMSQMWSLDACGRPKQGDKFEAFLKAAEEDNDYLILLGDTLDFSICDYRTVYEIARAFFQRLREKGVAREFIYVAGNHDSSVWHTVEYQVNTINRILRGEPISPFRHSVPGIIDDRPRYRDSRLQLGGVTPKEVHGRRMYGGLFLDYLARTDSNCPALTFNFAHPNVYLVTDKEESVLLTHGHYFEAYYAFVGELALKVAQCDLTGNPYLTLPEIVSVNFPLTQLACTGIGQAGPLTHIVRDIQRNVKDQDLRLIRKYLSRLHGALCDLFDPSWWKKLLLCILLKCAGKALLSKLSRYKAARFNAHYLEKENLERFKAFYRASLREIDEQTVFPSLKGRVPKPRMVIYGHTHEPVPFGASGLEPIPVVGEKVTVYNAGGWLNRKKNNKETFVGAEVFTYKTGVGLTSVSIR